MQQHPTLFLNKIKIKSCSSLCSCGCCTCVCQPHPCSDLSPSAQWLQTRRTEPAFQRNLNDPRSEFKSGGLNQAGRPTFFIKFAKATSLEQSTPSLHVCKRATENGHKCRPAGPTYRPLPEILRVVLVRPPYYPILPAFVQICPD